MNGKVPESHYLGRLKILMLVSCNDWVFLLSNCWWKYVLR